MGRPTPPATNTSWGDMLTNYNGIAITYDAIGNPSNWRNAISMSWDKRKLTSLAFAQNETLSFTYNSSGIRTQKNYINYNEQYNVTHNYLLDGTTILKETVVKSSVSGTTTYILYYCYDESGVAGFEYNGAKYHYIKNLQGDIVEIYDADGHRAVQYTYDAWGNVISITGSLATTIGQLNPFRYCGYYYDTETGFYYLQSRYYDPTVGRFLNVDGIIGANGGILGYNMFAYCNNNPIIGTDPSGWCRQMWREGKQGPCPGPDMCPDYIDPYDYQFEIRIEQGIPGPISDPNSNNSSQSSFPNTYTNDENPSYSSTTVSAWYDSIKTSFQMIIANAPKASNINLIDKFNEVIKNSSKANYVGYGIAIGIDIINGIDTDNSPSKIAYDIYVDTCVSGTQIALSFAAASLVINPFAAAAVSILTCWATAEIDETLGIRDWFKSFYEG